MIHPYIWYSVVLILLGVGLYAFLIEPHRLKVSRYDIHVPDLPESLDGLTICHLSDLHIGWFGPLEKRLRSALQEIDADVWVITGDIARRKHGLKAIRQVFDGFKPRLGIYAVTGNGDYKLGVPVEKLGDLLEDVGISLLRNAHTTICLKESKLHVIGVDDPFRGLDDLERAMCGIAPDGFKLLLAHSPDILMSAADRSVDMVLSGHTHGGQIRLPFVGPVWLHCRHSLGISDGCYDAEKLERLLGRKMQSARIIVSRGLGGSGIRARFLCPPEIAVIELRRRF